MAMMDDFMKKTGDGLKTLKETAEGIAMNVERQARIAAKKDGHHKDPEENPEDVWRDRGARVSRVCRRTAGCRGIPPPQGEARCRFSDESRDSAHRTRDRDNTGRAGAGPGRATGTRGEKGVTPPLCRFPEALTSPDPASSRIEETRCGSSQNRRRL